MKIKELIPIILKTKRRIAIALIVVAVLALALVYLFTYNHTAKTDTTFLNKLLEESSELTTAKLKITGITDYEDTGVPILTKSGFIMVYDATIRAGIDVKNVTIKSDDINKVIHVQIPKATIQEVKVDNSNIRYFDEQFALFNTDPKEDANDAVKEAEEDAIKDAQKTGILELADKQSATLIEGILSNAIPDGYKIEAEVIK